MTLIIEISRPFQARPGYFVSRVIYRVWWLWFAIAVLRVPFRDFAETNYHWGDD